ncbi:Anthocyanidin 3-O-glucosyltransferase 6 [Morella rubra]|uniref:Anthocyanidin 3-O-glucosyltransferase 6 n=1 Tax=Morella rubra TaxID=262757 RepID=A0A6A1V1J0_9ROSI|nr:Anthocyanidin 3-O-glucosyltransferase 6 [Morella rubra]
MASHKARVKEAIINNVLPTSVPLAGTVVDMFCCPLINATHKLGVPSYLFFMCNVAFLSFMLYLSKVDGSRLNSVAEPRRGVE